jgi:branched-subunit amino acid transport protein
MNLALIAIVITIVTFAWRYAGFSMKVSQTSPFWERFLRFIPIAVFTALVVSGLYKDSDLLRPELFALAIAGGVAWRTRQFGLSVISGLVALWGLAFLGIK